MSRKPDTRIRTVLAGDHVVISGGRLLRGHTVYPLCHPRDFVSHPPLLVMLPRRNSTHTTPSHVPPHLASGSVGGRRPLSLVTAQQAFRASTALTVETESPVSEMSPQEQAPPMPPRPTSFPHLPPGNGGLKRRSTRRDTYETCRSAPEENDQPQLPSMPMPTIPQISEPPTPTPTRPRQPAPGGGVGGFTPTSPYHGSNRDYSHHNTGYYPYRFDTMPSPRSDSDPPHYESADISGGIHAEVWPIYNKISQEFDEKRLDKWNKDLDVLLIFVSLVVRACR